MLGGTEGGYTIILIVYKVPFIDVITQYEESIEHDCLSSLAQEIQSVCVCVCPEMQDREDARAYMTSPS